jgi:hypothetical protein
MDRELFKTLAAGKFAMTNLEGTIDKQQMLAFVEGSTFAFDYLKKRGINEKGTDKEGCFETQQRDNEQASQSDG